MDRGNGGRGGEKMMGMEAGQSIYSLGQIGGYISFIPGLQTGGNL